MRRALLFAGALFTLLPASAAASAGEAGMPRTCKVGAYLIAVDNFDTARGTFSADFWFWSTCPSTGLRPLEVMDFVNGTRIERRLASTVDRSGISWSYVRVAGTFRHNWDLRSYPFDRHLLRVFIENTDAPASAFTYVADHEGSKVSRHIGLFDWRITEFKIEDQTYTYDTTFGDPALAGTERSSYSRLVLSISIERTRRLSFIKLIAGVHIAFALSTLTFLLGAFNGGRRTSLLVGTLFAALLNQRAAESVVGRSEAVTLLDGIHLVAMVHIFVFALAAIYVQWLHGRERQEEAARFDRRGFPIGWLTYLLLNVLLVWMAARRG
jgi:hypothetical protein